MDMNTSKREPIDLSDAPETIIEKMSEGNDTAKEILTKVLDDPFFGLFALMDLDDMNIRGAQVVAGYNYCGSKASFIMCARNRDKRMVDAINRDESCQENRAYTGGASSDRAETPSP